MTEADDKSFNFLLDFCRNCRGIFRDEVIGTESLPTESHFLFHFALALNSTPASQYLEVEREKVYIL
jgi:hypothetical protein